MPQPREHLNNAQRQAAYRKRKKQAIENLVKAKGLPTLPSISSVPGWPRWNQAMAQIEMLMTQIQGEMEAYHDQRTERWQDGEKGYEFLQKLEDLNAALDAVTTWFA